MKPLDSIEHTLFPYQERDMNNVINAFQNVRKLCFHGQTSYGKTYSFCTVAKWFVEQHKQRVLILCHKEELITQSAQTCIRLGLSVEIVYSDVKRYHHRADVYIAMEMTLHNRLKANPRFLNNVGLVVIDEAHDGHFDKHVEYFKNEKILGFTATPVLGERLTYWKCDRCQSTSLVLDECCNMEMMEWSKPKTMSLLYDDIVIGAPTSELLELGQIVKDINFIKDYADLSQLKTDKKGEFSNESQNQVFGNDEAVFNVLLNYETICKGKKTIIFNSSTKVNKLVYNQFKDAGYNIRLYDSVNETVGSRQEIVKWFENNDDAILTNVGCFTTGFDSREVQAIILNRSTTSLSLFLQMVGRGVRSSLKIFKDSVIVVDGGGNIDRFDPWSSDTRDWQKIFFEGIGKDRAKKEAPMNVQECDECGFLYPRSEGVCPNCGHKVPTKEKKEQSLSESVLVPLEKIPLPNGKKILEYTLRRGENIHFAFKILASQILDQFIFNSVSKELYLSTLANGKLDKRIGELCRKTYFILISAPEFKSDSNRKLSYVIGKTKEKIAKHYNTF